jgi:hypothetical protein
MMTRLAAILITSTALLGATQALAGVYTKDKEEEFFWTDEDQKGAGETADAKDPKTTPPSVNPLLKEYPVEDAPKFATPRDGLARYDEEDCVVTKSLPKKVEFSNRGMPGADDERVISPQERRSGEMTGDDGVVEVMQETPCVKMVRRGGETAGSLQEYTDPDDIRRANLYEDRRIPVHEVGRYAPEGSSLWHRDPANPYIDASKTWTVRQGAMLSEVLTAWGQDAGFNVVWSSDYDYVIQADVRIRGTFPEAAGQVIESYANANPPISADFHLANRVLVVDLASEIDGR